MYPVRVGSSNPYYPRKILIFALGHCVPLEGGEDEFSKNQIYFYKYGNKIESFLQQLEELYTLRFYQDTIKFDYLTLYPTRTKDSFNKNMIDLLSQFSEKINIPYKEILRRNRTIKANHTLNTFKDRLNNVRGSIDVREDVKNKRILLFDNTSTTGISLIDAADKLYHDGAKEVVGICLGLSDRQKQNDWNDLNKTLKYSRIKDICKSAFVSKEKREEWKKNRFE